MTDTRKRIDPTPEQVERLVELERQCRYLVEARNNCDKSGHVVPMNIDHYIGTIRKMIPTPPVAGEAPPPAPAEACLEMPPDGTIWRNAEGRECFRVQDGNLEWKPRGESWRSPARANIESLRNDCLVNGYTEHPPAQAKAPAQPAPAVESAEAVAERVRKVIEQAGDYGPTKITRPEYSNAQKRVENIVRAAITADRAALTASRDAEIERVRQTGINVAKALTHQLAARDATIKALDQSLGNLLAIIHRDGGHYYQQHGHVKAVEDAHAVWSRLIQSRDVLEDQLSAQPAAGVDKELADALRCIREGQQCFGKRDDRGAVSLVLAALQYLHAALAGGKA